MNCRLGKTVEKKVVKKKTRKRKPANKNTQGELLLFNVLNQCIQDQEYINHGYYSFLKSPKGKPMQLDRYYPDLKLAFEFQGEQHFKFNKWIHKTEDNFLYYQKCDKLKKKICKEKGITLIEVMYNHKINKDSILMDIEKHSKSIYKKIKGMK